MQQPIQYTGCKNWNNLPEKVKTKFLLTDTSFQFYIKKFLTEIQI